MACNKPNDEEPEVIIIEKENPMDSTYATQTKEESFTSDGYTLQTSIDIPIKQGEIPVVIFVPGSGGIDRDGTIPSMPEISGFYKKWGKTFAEKGIACFRFNKRALQLNAETAKDFDQTDQINDVIECLKFAKNYKEINATKFYLFGHSEGGNIVLDVASKEEVSGVFILNGSAIPIDELLLKQLEYNAGLEQKQIDEVAAAFEQVKQGTFPKDVLLMGANANYWKQWIDMIDNIPQLLDASKNIDVVTVLAGNDENFPKETLQQNMDQWQTYTKSHANLQVHIVDGFGHNLDYKLSAEAPESPLLYFARNIWD